MRLKKMDILKKKFDSQSVSVMNVVEISDRKAN